MVRDRGRWWWIGKKIERKNHGKRGEWLLASERTIIGNGAIGNGERRPQVREKERKKNEMINKEKKRKERGRREDKGTGWYRENWRKKVKGKIGKEMGRK